MRFSCTQENLHRGLETVSRASGRNAALPILGNILIKAESTGIHLSATNLEIGISCLVRGKVEVEGAYTVQAKLINDYVALLPSARIDVSLENGALTLKTEHGQTTIKGVPAEEFPLIPTVERKQAMVVPADALTQAINQVAAAAATDSSRPEINGVYLRIDGTTLTLAATDSYRLAERQLSVEGASEARAAIVPVRALQEIARMTGAGEATLTLFLTENQLLVSGGDTELVSRLIEGQYPDYEQIIPKTARTHARVSTEELGRIVRAASLFCKPGINDVALALDAKGTVTVSAANTQIGEQRTSIEGVVSGEANAITFNYRYLLDGLSSISTDEVDLEVTDAENPGLLKPTDGQPLRYLIMPIRQ
jgi:DNA polymerase III subunit beta